MTSTISPPASSDPSAPAAPRARWAGMLRRVLTPTVLLNVAAPFVIYRVLTGQGLSELTALAVGSVFPLAAVALGVLRQRRLDWIGLMSLVTILLGLTGGLLFDSARFLLVKDSIFTGVIGLAYLVSLAAPRPLVFLIGRQMTGDADARAAFDARWADPRVRVSLRRMTAIWGVAMIVEAGARVVLSFLVAPETLLLVSPLLAAAVFGPLLAWTLHRRTRLRARPAVTDPDNR